MHPHNNTNHNNRNDLNDCSHRQHQSNQHPTTLEAGATPSEPNLDQQHRPIQPRQRLQQPRPHQQQQAALFGGSEHWAPLALRQYQVRHQDDSEPAAASTLLPPPPPPPRRSDRSRIKPMAPPTTADTAAARQAVPAGLLAPPESPRQRQQQEQSPPGGDAGSQSSPCGRSPNPSSHGGGGSNHGSKSKGSGAARDLSPHRGVSSPPSSPSSSPPPSSESGESGGSLDGSAEFGDAEDAAIVHHHPDLLLPDDPGGMADLDSSHLSIIPHHPHPPPSAPAPNPAPSQPVSRNLTDAFESLYAVGGGGEGAAPAGPAGVRQQQQEEGREDVEEEGRSRGEGEGEGGGGGGAAPAVGGGGSPAAPTAAVVVPSSTPGAAQEDVEKDAVPGSSISPAGVEMLDVEGQLEPPGQQQRRHGAPAQDAPPRRPDPPPGGSGGAVVPFRLPPDLALGLPGPVVERVSVYGVLHDINREAGGMAGEDPSAYRGRAAAAAAFEAPDGSGGEAPPKDEERSPLVVAVNGPPPPPEEEEEPESEEAAFPEPEWHTKEKQAGDTGDGPTPPCRPDPASALIDEERWLLLAVSSRSAEEIAELGSRRDSCPSSFAEAMGEEPQEVVPPALDQLAQQEQQQQTANPLTALSGSRTQLWKPSRSWWEAKSGKNPWIEPGSHNKRWRYLWPLIHYHKFLARCIKKLKRNGVDVKSSLSPVSAFLRDEVCAVSDHLARASRFNSEEWMSALANFVGWTEQSPEAEERLRRLVARQKLRGWGEVEDVDSPLLRDQIDGRFLRAMAGARELFVHGGEPQYGGGKKGKKSGGGPGSSGRPPMPPAAGGGRQQQQQQHPLLSTNTNPMGGGPPLSSPQHPPMYPPYPMDPNYGGRGLPMHPYPGMPPPTPGQQPPRSNRKGGKQKRGSRGGSNAKAAAKKSSSDGGGGDEAGGSSVSAASPTPPPPYGMAGPDPSMMFPPGAAGPYGGHGHGQAHGYGMYGGGNPYGMYGGNPHPSNQMGHHHHHHLSDPMPLGSPSQSDLMYYHQQQLQAAAAAAQQGYHPDPSAGPYAVPPPYMDGGGLHHWPMPPYDGTADHHGHGHGRQQQHFSPEQEQQQLHLQQQLSAMASASAPVPLPIPCTPDQSMDYGYNGAAAHHALGESMPPSPAWGHLDQITANLIATPHQTPSAKRTGRKGGRGGSGGGQAAGGPTKNGAAAMSHARAARNLVLTKPNLQYSACPSGGGPDGGANVPPSPATQFAQSQSPGGWGGAAAAAKQIGGAGGHENGGKQQQPQAVETTTTPTPAMDTSTNPSDLSHHLAPPEVRRTASTDVSTSPTNPQPKQPVDEPEIRQGLTQG